MDVNDPDNWLLPVHQPALAVRGALGLPAIKLWAYDHVCLFGWPLPLPGCDDRAFIY